MREIKFRVYNDYQMKFDYISGVFDLKFWMPGYQDPQDVEWPKGMEQYTGLKDKNGVEIYEGDIVANRFTGGNSKGEIYSKALVKWGVHDIGCNGYEYNFNVVGPYVECEYMYGSMIEGVLEIIGNVHTTPELLEK